MSSIRLGTHINQGLFALLAFLPLATPAVAQVRPLYSPGFSATNSGILPDPGFTYMNYFQYFYFDDLKGPTGDTVDSDLGSAVFIDSNVFVYVTKTKLLGATLAFNAALPIASTSLTLADKPSLATAGYAQTWIQPFQLGWQKERLAVNAGYAFMADTGSAGAGYWGHALTLGDTFYLTKNGALSFSSYQILEFHTENEDTGITPGAAFSLDYSLMMLFPLDKVGNTLMQVGLVGYGQWQVSDDGGSSERPILSQVRYSVNALGFAVNFILPPKGASVGMKYLKEFGAEATVEGQSMQIYAAITF